MGSRGSELAGYPGYGSLAIEGRVNSNFGLNPSFEVRPGFVSKNGHWRLAVEIQFRIFACSFLSSPAPPWPPQSLPDINLWRPKASGMGVRSLDCPEGRSSLPSLTMTVQMTLTLCACPTF